MRYRSSNNKSFGSYDRFQASKEFYELGHRIGPSDGSIFNQLAVIETLSPSKSVPMMIYLYSRALGSKEPFLIAKENLKRLLKKFGNSFSLLLGIIDGTFNDHQVSAEMIEKLLNDYPNEEHLLYGSYLALSEHFNLVPVRVNNNLNLNLKMAILNNNLIDLGDDNGEDLNFYSTLIGSSFIGEDVQLEILKLFNPRPNHHETVHLPMSQ